MNLFGLQELIALGIVLIGVLAVTGVLRRAGDGLTASGALIAIVGAVTIGLGPALIGIMLLIGGLVIVAIRAPKRARGDDADREERVPCPYCAEAIKPEAVLCPHCRSDVRTRADRLLGGRSLNRLISAALVAVTFVGCVSVSPQGETVRITRNANDVRDCVSLGQDHSSSGWGGFAANAGFENNKAELRNWTAARGGDTLLLLGERGSA